LHKGKVKLSIRYILWLVKKWYWLIILAALIGGTVALGVNHIQPKVYAATTTLYVSSLNRNDYQTVLGAQQAAKAFTLFPQSDKVLQATLDTLRVPNLSLPQLSSMISVQNLVDTQFVSITVSYSDPRLAAQLASEIAKQSMAQFMASQANNIQSQQFIQQQMAILQTEINNLREQLTQAQLGTPSPTKNVLVNGLTTKLNIDQQYYGQLLNSQASISGFQVTVVQRAEIPTNPVGLSKSLAVGIGVLVGLVVIMCIILFMEQTRGIMVVRPGDQIMVLDQNTGLTSSIRIEELSAIKKPEQEPTMKLRSVLIPKRPDSFGPLSLPAKSLGSGALNGHHAQNVQKKSIDTMKQSDS
jgi:capsular polysaccharide biosynthesis protein